ncbi:MAG: PLP-dependent aminotransferase family protein [bacterium]|nr:PLP-dependent aminotransferase family protein [bacterium]
MTKNWIKNIDWDKDPLYLEIARALEEGIILGQLKPGQKLPTHRQLAVQLGVAIGTVTRAYAEAEQKGLLHGKGRRGTFVGKTRRGKDSLSALLDNSSAVVDFSVNYPPLICTEDFRAVFRQVEQQPKVEQLFSYQSPKGLERHRAAGVEWLKRLGLETDTESVLLCAGAQHGLNVVFSAITEPGDLVLAESVTYPGIKAVADLRKLRLTGVPMDATGICPDALETLCKTRKVKALYCIPTLQNPTNTILPLERRKEIARIAKQYDIAIVEDDIHRALVKKPPPSLASLAPEHTYFISSLSKILSGGLRVGFIKVPRKSYRRLLQTLQALVWNVSPLTFEMFNLLLNNGTVEKVITQRRKISEGRNRLAMEYLGDFAPGVHPHSSFLYMDLPHEWTPVQFSMEARRRGLSVSLGEIFAVNEKEAPHAIRICHGKPEDNEILQVGLKRLAAILKSKPTPLLSIL